MELRTRKASSTCTAFPVVSGTARPKFLNSRSAGNFYQSEKLLVPEVFPILKLSVKYISKDRKVSE
jgi:hypothetical protein